MVKLRKKMHFHLPNNLALLYLNKSYTNIFITLADMKRRVIIGKSSGSSAGIPRSKRRKIVPQAVENIFVGLSRYLKLYNIKKVIVILKIKMNVLFHYLIKELTYYNVKIRGFVVRRPIAFNGTRGRKLRRR